MVTAETLSTIIHDIVISHPVVFKYPGECTTFLRVATT